MSPSRNFVRMPIQKRLLRQQVAAAGHLLLMNDKADPSDGVQGESVFTDLGKLSAFLLHSRWVPFLASVDIKDTKLVVRAMKLDSNDGQLIVFSSHFPDGGSPTGDEQTAQLMDKAWALPSTSE